MKATRDDFMKATQNVMTSRTTLELVSLRPEIIEPMVDFSILICNRLTDREFDSHDFAKVVDFLGRKIMPDDLTVDSYMLALGIISFGLRLYDELEDVLISRKVAKGLDR